MIEFRQLNKAGLDELVSSPGFAAMPEIPITRHRALSQLHNPRMDEKDILLVVAFRENQMIGYAGILPDYIFSKAGAQIKCGWLSGLWVSEKARGENLGRQLMQKALVAWDQKILSTEFVPFTKKIYDQTGAFAEPQVKHGVRLYFNLNLHTLLPPKSRIFQKTRGVLKLADSVGNILLSPRLLFSARAKTVFTSEIVPHPDPEANAFIQPFVQEELFRRNTAELNWILNYPWILLTREQDDESGKYYFSSREKNFEYKILKLRDAQGTLSGILFFSLRNSILKLQYAFIHPSGIRDAGGIILQKIREWKVSIFTTYHPGLTGFFKSAGTGALKKKSMVRPYLVSKAILHEITWNENFVQDGDGDCVFT